ncbi:Voltage-dependent calcium channel subunit alpha-2/delta-1 [Branchiostoma belcheri]|nr:Voltage-dependent calcium channel subunit alpha-2/delta-1 [Branchiostoma belcheri]
MEWGDRLEEELYNIVRKYSGVEELKNYYRDHQVNLNVVDVDGLALVQQTAKEIDGLLSKKMKALEGFDLGLSRHFLSVFRDNLSEMKGFGVFFFHSVYFLRGTPAVTVTNRQRERKD